MNIIDNVVAYRPQLLPSTEVAKFCTYKHTSPTEGTYYGRTYGFDFTIEELNNNRWFNGVGYMSGCQKGMQHALNKHPGWNSWTHEVCVTHLFDWECSFVECCGVLESMSTGHSYNLVIPKVGSSGYVWTKERRDNQAAYLKKHPMTSGDVISRSLHASYRSGKISVWNKGLTKDDDPRLADFGKRVSQALTGRTGDRNAFFGKHHTDEYKTEQATLKSAIVHLSNGWVGNKYELAELFSAELSRNISYYMVGDWIFRPVVRFPKYVLLRFPDLKVTSIEYYNGKL